MRLKWKVVWMLWLLVVLTLSLTPSGSLNTSKMLDFPNLDKVVHAFMYLILSFTMLKFFAEARISYKSWYVFIFCAILGIGIEMLQSTNLIHRSFEYADIIANIIGALAGIVIFKLT